MWTKWRYSLQNRRADKEGVWICASAWHNSLVSLSARQVLWLVNFHLEISKRIMQCGALPSFLLLHTLLWSWVKIIKIIQLPIIVKVNNKQLVDITGYTLKINQLQRTESGRKQRQMTSSVCNHSFLERFIPARSHAQRVQRRHFVAALGPQIEAKYFNVPAI